MNKRMIALALVLVLAFGFAPSETSVAAAPEERTAQAFVEALVGSFSLSKADATRADFVAAVCRVLRIEGAPPAEAVFSDVLPSDEYAGAVDAAYRLGWVSGADGAFNPQDTITYPEAVKIAVCALGYSEVALAEGGYPTGYLYVADRLGLTDRLSFTADDSALSLEELYIFIENMLHAKVAKIVGNGLMTTYNTEETVLEYYYDVFIQKGIIDNVKNASLTSEETYTRDMISINGNPYYYDGYAADFLGRSVQAYYYRDEAADSSVIVYLKFTGNTEVTLKSRDYSDLSGNKLRFYVGDSSKATAYTLSDTYSLLYNGKKVTDKEAAASRFASCNGFIRLLDNNSDGLMDVVFIEDYAYTVVSEVDAENEVIADVNAPENKIDLRDTDYVMYDFDTKEPMELGNIKIGSVVAAAFSEDRAICRLYVCQAAEEGAPEQISDGEVVLNGNTYDFSAYYEKYYAAGLNSYESGVYYIGISGDVVAYSASASYMRYGYCVAVQHDTASLAPKNQVKLLTDNGQVAVYDLADRVVVDGVTRDAKDVDLSGSVGMLIRYSLRDNRIQYVDTAEPLTEELMFAERTFDSLTKADVPAASDLVYRSGSYSFNNAYVVKNSVVFVPNADDIEKSQVGNNTLLVTSRSYRDAVEFYDVDGIGQAGAIVVTKSQQEYLQYSTNRYVISGVSQVLDDSGEECYQLEVMSHTGVLKTYYMDYDLMPVKKSGKILGFGDIIRFFPDYADRRITCVTVDFDGDPDVFAPEDSGIFQSSLSSNYTMRMGMVYNYDHNYVSMSNVQNPDGTYNFDLGNLAFRTVNTTNLVHISYEGETIRKATQDDFKSYRDFGDDASVIVIADNYTAASGVFIYEK